ncbi:MAG: hypothetical protein NC321_00835 [Clostridium sp.]|nr:hypothetical protein [Clostridium sp.]
MKNCIKLIRISVFLILSLMFIGYVITECVNTIKIRTILFIILYFVLIRLIVMWIKEPKCATPRMMILDFVNIAIFIVLMASWGKGLLETDRIMDSFQGNNEFLSSYVEGIDAKGYDDIECALEDRIEYEKKTLSHNELEEIYRIQVEEKIFVYFKEDEGYITEFEFFKQNDLYYSSGSKALLYGGVFSSDNYTTEETIRKDIANTMWRGVGFDEVGVPAWGVSTDENIFSMTINSENVDDVIFIDEKGGKKYYFWIITNVEEIKTVDDVKVADIEMNSIQ